MSDAVNPTESLDRLGAALERIAFLEWRIEQLEGLLVSERRSQADARLEVVALHAARAQASQREQALETRLAEALKESALLHERLEIADSTRSTLETRLDDRGERTASEMAELCRELLVERQRAEVKSQALSSARGRIQELEQTQHRFFDRVVRWQDQVRSGERDQIDLVHLIAELRDEILRLSHEQSEAGRTTVPSEAEAGHTTVPHAGAKGTVVRPASGSGGTVVRPASVEDGRGHIEAVLSPTRKAHALRLLQELKSPELPLRLSAAKALVDLVGGDAAPAILALYGESSLVETRTSLLELLGKTGPSAAGPVSRVLVAAGEDPEWRIRAAALEARLRLAQTADEAEAVVAAGLLDADARVRRRMVLASASERPLASAALAEILAKEKDPQTRRMVAAALRGRTEPAVLRALFGALADTSEAVRGAAARALEPVCGARPLAVVQLGDAARRSAIAEMRGQVLREAHGPR